jgi:pyruvate dehydrogenase E2 component (dihydrolipoamide acetyltransferase)
MSEIKTLEMPKWGLSMEEGLLARWAIQEGDSFTKGQEICEIETSKIVNVLEALCRYITSDNRPTGDTLQVGAVLALVADASVSDAELDEFAASLATEKTAASGTKATEPDVLRRQALSRLPLSRPLQQPRGARWADRSPRQSARRDRCDSG